MATTKDKGKEGKEKKPRTRRPAASKSEDTMEVPKEESGTTPVAVAERSVAEEPQTETKICGCHRNNGESCGRPAPEWGPFNEDCYEEHQIEIGKVKCANFADCGEWVMPFIKDGAAVPTYGKKCREDYKAGNSPAVAVSQKKDPRQHAVDLNIGITALLPEVQAVFPNRDFGKFQEMHQEGKAHLVAKRTAEAISSFEAVFINLKHLESAYQIATEEIPEALAELSEITEPYMTRPGLAAEFRMKRDEAQTWARAENLEACLAAEPADAGKYLTTRLQRIEAIIEKVDERIEEIEQIDAGIAATPVEEILPKLHQRYGRETDRSGGKEARQARRQTRRGLNRGNLVRVQESLIAGE